MLDRVLWGGHNNFHVTMTIDSVIKWNAPIKRKPQRMTSEKSFVNPKGLPKSMQAFLQIVIISNHGMKTIDRSGQVSVDRDNNLIGGDDLSKQADRFFKKSSNGVGICWCDYGGRYQDQYLLKNYKPDDSNAVSCAFRSTFPFENLRRVPGLAFTRWRSKACT